MYAYMNLQQFDDNVTRNMRLLIKSTNKSLEIIVRHKKHDTHENTKL